MSLDGTDFQSIGSFDLTATSSQYTKYTFSLNDTSLGNVSGKTGYIRFELTHPGTGIQLGIDRVYIDNVRLLGVGLPLQTESAAVTTGNAPIQIAQTGITSLIETARLQWQGLVQVPEGSVGVALRQVGVTATDLLLDKGTGTSLEHTEKYGDTRGSEGGFNDQFFLANTNAILSLGALDQQSAHDKARVNGDLSPASDSHPIQSELNTILSQQETSASGTSVVDPNSSFQANVHPDGTVVNDSTVSVPHFNVGFDFSTPSGERAATDFEFLNTLINSPASHACPPKVDTEPLPYAPS